MSKISYVVVNEDSKASEVDNDSTSAEDAAVKAIKASGNRPLKVTVSEVVILDDASSPAPAPAAGPAASPASAAPVNPAAPAAPGPH